MIISLWYTARAGKLGAAFLALATVSRLVRVRPEGGARRSGVIRPSQVNPPWSPEAKMDAALRKILVTIPFGFYR